MKNLLRLIVVTLACQASMAQAFWGDGWLDFYQCQDRYQIMSCKSCSLEKGAKIKFVVNPSKATVIEQVKMKDVVQPPNLLKDCAILDEKNWSCTYKDRKGLAGVEVTHGMANGVYSRAAVLFNIHGEQLNPAYFCAK